MWFVVANFLVLESFVFASVHESQVTMFLQTSNKTNAIFWTAGFMYLFLAVLGLYCCTGCSLVALRMLLIAGASFVSEHRVSGAWTSVAVAHGLRS